MTSNLVVLVLLILFELTTANVETCGKTRGFIVGGNRQQSVQRNDFPWITALVDSKNSYFCGGVLISKTRVLTAAHCILPKLAKTALLPRDVRIILGVFDLSDPFEVGRISVAIDEIKMHPNWNPSTSRYDGDIAVLQMEDPVTFNKFIQPICLISSGLNTLSFENGNIVGYGLSSKDSNKVDPIPKVLNVPIVKDDDCYKHNPTLKSISSKNTFCAGYGNGADVCFGDSGSGLYIKHNKTHYLRGIMSASLIDSDTECDANDYAVITEISNFYAWITEKDDFILSQNSQKVSTKTVQTTKAATTTTKRTTKKTTKKTGSGIHFPSDLQLPEVKFRNQEYMNKFNIEEHDLDIDIYRK